jgi:uncharacterized protein YbjT (DUF2867 family)
MRVLVFGATGASGSRLVPQPIERGYETATRPTPARRTQADSSRRVLARHGRARPEGAADGT